MLIKIIFDIFYKIRSFPILLTNLSFCMVVSTFLLNTELHAAPPSTGSCWISGANLNFGSVSANGGKSNTNVQVTCNQYNQTKTVYVAMCIYIPAGDPSLANNRRRITDNSNYLSYDLFYDAALTQRIDTTANSSTLRCVNQTFSTSENQKTASIPLYGYLYPGQNVRASDYKSYNIPVSVIYAYSDVSTPTIQDVLAQNRTASNNMVVTANYENGCYLQSVPDLNFGQTDNLLQEKTSSTTISLSCPTNTTWKVRLDNGLNYDGTSKRMRKGTDYIPYALYQNSNFTQVWDASSVSQNVGNNGIQQIQIYGKVPVQSKTTPAGDYVDTVTITLMY